MIKIRPDNPYLYLLYVMAIILVISAGINGIRISVMDVGIGPDGGDSTYGYRYYYWLLPLTSLFWGLAYWLQPRSKLGALYWVTVFMMTTTITALDQNVRL
jgi:succinate dehydrogenase/fumarate reductase cytochrome b subunit